MQVPWQITYSLGTLACRCFPCLQLGAVRCVWCASSQEEGERFVGCAADLTVIAVLAAGNDYLPALRGTSLPGTIVTPSLWKLYLRLRNTSQWADQCEPT